MIQTLKEWTQWFDAIGVSWKAVDSNPRAISLVGMPGAPLFRVVESLKEANELHAKARQKSEEMQRLLVVALPLQHPLTLATLPGDIVLPKARVYAGHAGSTFNLSGHHVECAFLTEVKKEVLNVMANGVSAKTPICDWLVKLAGTSWVYGTPSSLAQIDSLLGLICRDTSLLGHVRSRQLSFGRGCADALLLPVDGVVLKNHRLDQKVEQGDLRFIGLEVEISQRSAARDRIYSMFADKFLAIVDDAELGTAAQIGPSRLGATKQTAPAVSTQKMAVKAEGRLTNQTPLTVSG